MTYRILPAEEWPRLASIIAGKEQYLPTPDSAICAVAENALGEIVGCLFFQKVFHVEPLVLKTPHARFDRLLETIETALAEYKGLPYYTFSDSEVVEGMARHVGMHRLPYTGIWIKEI